MSSVRRSPALDAPPRRWLLSAAGRRLLPALALCLCCTLPAQAGGTYVEGRLGLVRLSDLSGSGTIDSNFGLARLEGEVSGELSYDDSLGLGAEVGVEELFGTSLRISASVDAFRPDLNRAELAASLTINDVPVPDTPTGQSFDAAAVTELGLDFSRRMGVVGFNAYYDFKLGGFKPYVGGGYGLYVVEGSDDYETGISLQAGVRYEFTPLTYVGARLTVYEGNGPTDSSGIVFKDLDTTTFAVSVGVRL